MSTPPAPYDGHVEAGGAASFRELPTLRILKVSVGPMDNNAYVLTCQASGAQLLIDAAAQPGRLLPLLNPTHLQAILTTHSHRDHWQEGLTALRAACPQARTHAGADDIGSIGVPTDVRLHHGDTLRLGLVHLAVIGLRGHTPGGVALHYHDPAATTGITDHVWTGDSLFPGGPGKTNSALDFTTLVDDLQSRIFDRLPDSTWVYPGHGDDTTLGTERPHLATWRQRGW